jgi:hypothetical protein
VSEARRPACPTVDHAPDCRIVDFGARERRADQLLQIPMPPATRCGRPESNGDMAAARDLQRTVAVRARARVVQLGVRDARAAHGVHAAAGDEHFTVREQARAVRRAADGHVAGRCPQARRRVIGGRRARRRVAEEIRATAGFERFARLQHRERRIVVRRRQTAGRGPRVGNGIGLQCSDAVHSDVNASVRAARNVRVMYWNPPTLSYAGHPSVNPLLVDCGSRAAPAADSGPDYRAQCGAAVTASDRRNRDKSATKPFGRSTGLTGPLRRPQAR